MDDNRWWIWGAVVFVFLAYRALRAAARMSRGRPGVGMARLNAAAERILKERGVTAANRIPHTTPPRNPAATTKPRNNPAVMKAGAKPAVMRRDSLLASGKEPVIQRRR